ncbi:MAG: GtrA family protein [Lachnospiraceae bacterium]|nr:GtrA family protein [Lachnospiraceae bacterium]
MEKIKELCRKYEEIIAYLIVGVLNTLVSWGAWFLCAYTILDAQVVWQNVALSIISWVVGVVFGYVMNRKYVFKSTDPKIMKEFLQFSGGRVSTGVLDSVMMVIMVNFLTINESFSKIFVSVLVMIGNYLISKLFVFKKDGNEAEAKSADEV